MRSALSSDGSSSTTRTLVTAAAQTGAATRSRRDREDDPCPAADVGVDPDESAVGLDERLGDGQAEARPAAAAVLAEHLEDAFPVLRRDARTVVGDRDLDPRRAFPGAAPRRDTDDAADGRQPLGVLEHVRQDLADEDVIDVQERQAGRRVDRHAAGRQDAAQQGQRLIDQLRRSRSSIGRSSSAPASIRVMSRRLVTSRARRSDCSSISSSSSARSSGLRRAPTWRRFDTAVLMEAKAESAGRARPRP